MLDQETILKRAREIKLLMCDVDGVLTDGQTHYNQDGIIHKSFHVHDGLGLQLLMQSNIQVAVVTTCQSPIIKTRMQQLGISHLFQGIRNKVQPYHELIAHYNFDPSQVAYMGDDLPDLPLLEIVGLGVAVANAHAMVKQQAHLITVKSGGFGAVREVCDLILQAQDGIIPAFKRWRDR